MVPGSRQKVAHLRCIWQDFETSLREYLQLGKSARLTPRSRKEGAIVCFTAKVRLESRRPSWK